MMNIWSTLLPTTDNYRDIQEDLENLYGRRPDPHWHSEPPTSHEQWRIFAEGHPPEQGDHEEYFQFGEGDFLQEFEQMFQSMFRGFSFDFNPPTQGLHTLKYRVSLSKQYLFCAFEIQFHFLRLNTNEKGDKGW